MEINLEQEKLGELLVDRDVISSDELDHALQFQENMGGKLGEILVQLDLVTEEQVVEAVADQQNMEIVDLSSLILPQDLIDEVPREVIEEHEVIPIGLVGDNLRLAIHDPFDIESIEEVGLATDYHIEPVLAPRQDILQAIDNLFYEGEKFRSAPVKEPAETEDAEQDAGDAEGDAMNLNQHDTAHVVRSLVHLLIDKDIVSEQELTDALQD